MTDWPDDWFEQFWSVYPRRIAKLEARKALDRIRRSGEVDYGIIFCAAQNFARAMRGKDVEFIPYPARWINRGQWEDEMPAQDDDAIWRTRRTVDETLARRKMQ